MGEQNSHRILELTGTTSLVLEENSWNNKQFPGETIHLTKSPEPRTLEGTSDSSEKP